MCGFDSRAPTKLIEMSVDLNEVKPIKERKIDFSKYPVAANRTVYDLVDRVNVLLEVVKFQQEEINQLKSENEKR